MVTHFVCLSATIRSKLGKLIFKVSKKKSRKSDYKIKISPLEWTNSVFANVFANSELLDFAIIFSPFYFILYSCFSYDSIK